MPLAPGTKIGHYEVTALLGAGGMGEVYRARDSRLNRDVAIKVLSAAFVSDPSRMARFEREAQVLAALNHPNIATIYGLEGNAIAMELVEGKDLAGPLTLEEALPIARQIVEALEAAHEKGIVHRDLKPANIKITPDGVVKLLDFGLATAPDGDAANISMSNSPTMSLAMTQAGMIMGTAGYMSPEQAAGKTVDKRADVWSFGVVMVEMLSGRKLFEGETVAHTLADVLRAEVDLSKLPESTPPAIRRLIGRCLDRNVKNRLRDIGEARILLQDPVGGTASPAQAESLPHRLPIVPWVVAAVAIIVAGILYFRPEPLRPLIRLTDELGPESLSASVGSGRGLMAISPDGSRIAVTLAGADGKGRIHTRLLQQTKLIQLAGTENAGTLFFSPDGQWIGFHADGKLKKISVDGGIAVTIVEAPSIRGASWGDDGNIVASFGNSTALSRVSSAGGSPTPLTKLKDGERTNRWPQVLPGSQAVLFSAYAGNNSEEANIDVVALKTGERKTVLKGGHSPHYAATSERAGYLLFLRNNTLFSAPFNSASLSVTGSSIPVLEEVSSNTTAGGNFALSASGTLIFKSGKDDRTAGRISLFDSAGNIKPLLAVPGSYATPRLSPDGKRLAFSMGDTSGGNSDIWVKDLDRDTPSRLTFLPGGNNYPVWTPDGKSIVFRNGDGLYWIRADGAGEAQRLTSSQNAEYSYSISPDGKRLAFFNSGANGSMDIFTAQIGGDPAQPKLGKPELFIGTTFVEIYPAFSPDGRWLAYGSDESGTYEIYVRPFPGPGGRWQISSGGGRVPQWSKDGRELFYEGDDRRVMAVSYRASGDTFTAAKPRVWSEVRLSATLGIREFDITPDGKHIVAILPETEEKPKPDNHLTVLLNFIDELKRKAP